MAKMLVGSIDLNKIDKKRIVSTDKNGKPFENGAKYYNVVVWVNDEVDQYGNIASIQESISKEERESGVKPSYVGNLKDVQGATNSNSNEPFQKIPESNLNNNEESDLPF